MKLLLTTLALAFFSSNVDANTSVCSQTKSKIEDFQVFGKCIADIPPDDQTD